MRIVLTTRMEIMQDNYEGGDDDCDNDDGDNDDEDFSG